MFNIIVNMGDDTLGAIDRLEALSDRLLYYAERLPIFLIILAWMTLGGVVLRNTPYWVRLAGLMVGAWFGAGQLGLQKNDEGWWDS